MENYGRPTQLTDGHLKRLAVVYLRQSTKKQVEENGGSTDDQRWQAEHARRWGFGEKNIQINDDDLGTSGTATEHRSGYQRLLRQIKAGEVGLVLASDSSRLGRNAVEFFNFLADCAKHDTLVAISGRVFDPGDFREMLAQRMLGLAAEFDNQLRRDTLAKGRLAQLRNGKSVSRPPAGYVRDGKGQWKIDGDPLVQAAIRSVFAFYLRYRALVPTMKALKEAGIRIPRRSKHGDLRWVEPVVHAIEDILHNRSYVGDYVYGQRKVVPALGRAPSGAHRVRRVPADQQHIILDHHAAYVSREEFDEVQSIMRINAPGKARRNLGPGTALVQGLVRCGVHDRAMATRYHSRQQTLKSFHGYQCNGDYLSGGSQCDRISGHHLDRAVREAVLARLSPPAIELLREQWRAAKSVALSGERRLEAEIARARREVADAKHRSLAVDPSLELVWKDLNKMWQDATERLVKLESQQHPTPTAIDAFTEEHWNEVLVLAQDVEAIWDAQTTECRDRKEIVRLLIKNVIVEDRSQDHLCARIVWKDGTADSVLKIGLPRYARKLIAELADQGTAPEEIAALLNERGLRTVQGNPWIKETVRGVIRLLRRRSN